MNKRVIITGGSGFIGSALSWVLLQKNYDVVSVDMMPPKSGRVMFVECDLSEGIPEHHYLERPTYIINLAGAPIFGRWTTEKKEQIYQSRINGTANLVNLIQNPKYRPEALVSGSATGYYGDTGTINVDERTESGEGFLAQVASDWEEVAFEAEKLGVRTTIIRNAHVLGLGGLMKMLRPFYRLKVLPQTVPGQVCLPWIHLDDLCNIYHLSMEEPQAPKVINAVAPQISTYGEFYRTLADLTNAKVIKIPESLTVSILGELATEMTNSQCVRSEAISSRYKFKYPNLEKALRDITSA